MKRKRRKPGRGDIELAWMHAARAVFIPMVGALLDAGLRAPDVLRLVEEALLLAAIEAGNQTDGAIQRRTGLPRRTVDRVRCELRVGTALALSYASAVRIVGRWATVSGTDAEGCPKSLPLHGDRSFDMLAELVGVDPAAALRELRRVGAVRVGRAAVTLVGSAYIPRAGMIEKLDILGRDGAEFLRAQLHNIRVRPAAARLQRKASYDNIGSNALPELRRVLRAEGERALETANRALAAVDRDRCADAPGGGRNRVSFGVYVYQEPVADSRRERKDSRRGKRSRA